MLCPINNSDDMLDLFVLFLWVFVDGIMRK